MKDKDNKDEKKPNWKEKIKKVNWWMVLAVIALAALLLSYAYRVQEAKLAAPAAPSQSSGQTGDQTGIVAAAPNCQEIGITFGKSGSFRSVWDSNMKTCVLGMWEEARLSPGMSLADLKIQGDDYSFLMPFKGSINHSADTIFVNNTKCTPGNPVSCDGKTSFEKNTPVHIVSEPGNDSSGVMLIQNP